MARLVVLTYASAAVAAGAHGGHSHSSHGHTHDAQEYLHAHNPVVGDAPPGLLAKPFDLSDYTLAPGSSFAYRQARNLQYLTSYNVTNLCCQYTGEAAHLCLRAHASQ